MSIYMEKNVKDMNERRKCAFDEISGQFKTLSAMAKYFGVSGAAITKWKKDGIPPTRVPYFRLCYPNLEAWKGLPRIG